MKSFIEKEAQEKAEEILAKVHYIHERHILFCSIFNVSSTNVKCGNGTEYMIEYDKMHLRTSRSCDWSPNSLTMYFTASL